MAIFFQEQPEVYFASHTFLNVPTILQHEEVPLLEVGQYESAGYSAKFHVFNSDGRSLVVVKGSQMYETEDGKKSNIRLVHEPNLTACELNGETLLELRREGAAGLRGWAELYAPNGTLVRASDRDVSALVPLGPTINVGGAAIRGTKVGNTLFGCAYIQNCDIGIFITDGRITIGYSDWGHQQTCVITGHLPGCPPVSKTDLPKTKRPDISIAIYPPTIPPGLPIIASVELRSSGRAPAKLAAEAYRLFTGDDETAIERVLEAGMQPEDKSENAGHVMPEGSKLKVVARSQDAVTVGDTQRIANGTLKLFVIAHARYENEMGRQYYTRACAAYDHEEGSWEFLRKYSHKL
ncbi:MAG: hypothetical protein DWQ37_13850 [Planctomycetota bacterium]|nr:MAG: hypothetical protein DWQ37_13850 [Planctomycetota bacterium]